MSDPTPSDPAPSYRRPSDPTAPETSPHDANWPSPRHPDSGASTHGHPVTPPPSVRLALPAEAAQIAALQRRAWLADEATRGIAEKVDLDQATQVWWQAISRPPMAHFRVLVAVQPRLNQPSDDAQVEGGSRHEQVVCGFAAFGPSDDPDADERDELVAEFCIDSAATGLGHDDRLLNAVADTARADGYERLTWWLPSTDDRTREWLAASGWAPDGAHREVGTDDAGITPVRIKQVRLHTDISQPA